MNHLNGKSCVDCGNETKAVLQFDHLRDKHKNISFLVSKAYSIKMIKEEIEKCEIVCANCHTLRTFKRSNSYRLS